ncbi:DUF3916 domain-containing protein [Synechococcus elongatus]|uniref:DUF3916 domain-containing protein n=2 Tax=Synechococcus elongatus TaxID=32046 RepID=Q31K02_SYNE7|nr:DUF3916 domain-containing protein [Synechococcus elongatus]ABB58617.1 conserved hypothetical protein [Synechococcus elongatus PCC 7942 = FACHB-805]AJD56930.1 hypothetical protein M744_03240 [Synechococcus elongatus UTEX 2973]MBD2587838.1 DUF3916 domain-containing protein [Synechococcus elongatus FACHB-242]MBD2688906.1 DUF3916 domain-containing protein [Synechococcus elongatus FACHB-1061]MBD2707454.1 DUF3916 domain-containing protein [Synechococcus elongatus PCC 7942 = FACHB-805]
MRRLDLSQRRKPRGIPRRLRSLNYWADRFVTLPLPTPEDCGDSGFWNWKLPVIGSLANHPSPRLRSQCLQALIRAADNLAQQTQAAEADCYVACLIELPYLFGSEVTLFYSRSYYRSFYGDRHALAPRSLAQEYGLQIPAGWVERGFDVTQPEQRGPVEWWVVGQLLESDKSAKS